MASSQPLHLYTPVLVSKLSHGVFLIENKYFSDIQYAWMYIKSQRREVDEEDERNFLASFQRTVQCLGESHRQGGGFLCAILNNIHYAMYYVTDEEYRTSSNSV
jgi:hypothetical protein